MKIVNMSKIPKESYIHPIFTGPDVTRQILLPVGVRGRC